MCCRKRQRIAPLLVSAAAAAMSQTKASPVHLPPTTTTTTTPPCRFHGQNCNSNCEINYDIESQAPRYMTVAANNGSKTSLTSQVFLDENKDALSSSPPPTYSKVQSLIPERSASPVSASSTSSRRDSNAASSVYSSEYEKKTGSLAAATTTTRGETKFFFHPKTLSYDHPVSVLDQTGPLSSVVEQDIAILGSQIATYGLTGRCCDKCRAKKAMNVLLKDLEVAMTARALIAGVDGSACHGGLRKRTRQLSCREKSHIKGVLRSVRREIKDEIWNA